MNETKINEIEWFEPNTIELLGYAKNNIVEAKEKAPNLPSEYKEELSRAYSLVHKVQEYLFNN